MNLLIKAEVKKLKRLKIISVGYISILLSAFITYIQAFTMRDRAITFLNFTDMYLYNNAVLFFPFMLALLGGYMIDREYILDTRKNLLVIPLEWCHVIKAKLFVLMLLTVYFSFLAAAVSGISGLILKCPDFTYSLFLEKGFSFLILGVCICVGILPIILWFSRKKGKYVWGSILSALMGITSVFVVNGKLVNWHPITYCFSIISDRLTVPTNWGILMSIIAFGVYILILSLMYWLLYQKSNQL